MMNLVTVERMSKQVQQQQVLKSISLTIKAASRLGIKMTTQESSLFFKLLLQQIKPTSGKIWSNPHNIMLDLAQDGLYQQLSVHRYFILFCRLARTDLPTDSVLAEFSLADVWHERIKKLTSGQQRRISLLRMVLFKPELILIQSPLSGMSNEEIGLYLQALKYLWSQGIATVVTSTYMEELLLLSQTVYRYQAAVGLEKTDLQVDSVAGVAVETNNQQVFKVACKLEDKTVFFSPNEIDFVESINGVSNVSVGSEYFPTTITMAELTTKLTQFGFFRCHRSYLVNLQRVAELISYSKNSYTLILKGVPGTKLPLSRSKVLELQQLLAL